jgi:hypothetical protein
LEPVPEESPVAASRLKPRQYSPVLDRDQRWAACERRGTWGELRTLHAESTTRQNFKDWLQSSRGAVFDDQTLRQAALELDSIPVEFLELMDLCNPEESS